MDDPLENITLDDNPALPAQYVGAVLVRELIDGGVEFWVYVQPDATEELRSLLREWVTTRLRRLFEHGPEPDGWARQEDGCWRLCARPDESLAQLDF